MTITDSPRSSASKEPWLPATQAMAVVSLSKPRWDWLKTHLHSLLLLLIGLSVVTTVAGVNFANYPIRFGDEATYVPQAWAVWNFGDLSHYTHWWDHYVAGWTLMALYMGPTGAFTRYASSTSGGRELMVVLFVLSAALVYGLARRFGMNKGVALGAMLLYGLCPLAVYYGRQVFLDNVGMPWLLGAMLLALTPRKNLRVVIVSGIFTGMAFLSKETMALWVPAVLYAVWWNSDRRNAGMALGLWTFFFSITAAVQFGHALLKDELFPGPGHVSLLGTLGWQLSGRGGSGSVFDLNSDAWGTLRAWTEQDYLLVGACLVVVPLALCFKRTDRSPAPLPGDTRWYGKWLLRPVMGWFLSRRFGPLVLAIVAPVGYVTLRSGGYLPYPFVIGILPFAALLVAGVVGALWGTRKASLRMGWLEWARKAVVAVMTVAAVAALAQAWVPKLQDAMTVDADSRAREAVAWIDTQVPKDAVLAVDAIFWLDLVQQGRNPDLVVWNDKPDSDPEVAARLGGAQNIDYIVVLSSSLSDGNLPTHPTLFAAAESSTEIARFGVEDPVLVLQRNTVVPGE